MGRHEPPQAHPSGGDAEPVRIPVNGVLDLHTFRPKEIGRLIPDYLQECRDAGILQVRIIHGKGTGTLRETVHTLLRRDPRVSRFGLADETGGGWGATVVYLRRAGGTEDGERRTDDGGRRTEY